MNYVDYCHKLYKLLEKTDFKKVNVDLSNGFVSLISSAAKLISWDDLKAQYRREIQETINIKLAFFRSDIEMLRQLKEVSFYEDTMSVYTSLYLFWIWNNDVAFSRDVMDKFVRAIFTGTIGYRLLDMHTDSGFIGKEAIFLGNYMIRSFEEEFFDVFEPRETMRIFNKHVRLFTEAEYLEKRHMWKPCPFRWDDAKILGQKASPLFSIFEIILRISKVEQKKSDDLIAGLTYISAGIQMIDDLSDGAADLANGIETLAMSDFYEKHGTNSVITNELMQKFLTKDRLLKIYDTAQQMFGSAREIFTKYDDDMLLLFVEIQNFKLNVLYEATDEDE